VENVEENAKIFALGVMIGKYDSDAIGMSLGREKYVYGELSSRSVNRIIERMKEDDSRKRKRTE
jgi:hypothetical protein